MEIEILHMFLISVELTGKVKFRVISLNPLDSLPLLSVLCFFIDNLTIPGTEPDNTETESQAKSWKENEKFSPFYGI